MARTVNKIRAFTPKVIPRLINETEHCDGMAKGVVTVTYRRERLASALTFLAAAFPGFAFALFCCLIFFFSPSVSLVFLTSLVFSFALGMMVG